MLFCCLNATHFTKKQNTIYLLGFVLKIFDSVLYFNDRRAFVCFNYLSIVFALY